MGKRPAGENDPPARSAAGDENLVWKSRPVFISSTFRDMQAERDHLSEVVFPRVAEELRKRRVHLEAIDLRQGVETAEVPDEAARELLVLKVCLDEIRRSRPFLLVLLGDRYGWVPPDERMAAAAQEAGFRADLAGKSVTALEVEFGVLKDDPDQRRRSYFFFREPLPCQDPDYNDADSPDPEVRARHDKLLALKKRIADDPELGPRVHTYRAGWDAQRRRVTGLDDWGNRVFDLLWKDLDEETCDYVLQPPPTWEEAERRALAEFVEHRTRDFVGREEITLPLLDLALSGWPASRKASVSPNAWGACVIGGPGSGKSALFAHLYRRLPLTPLRPNSHPPGLCSPLLLANAAGISARSASVDAMLRRWIQELADFLKAANPLPEKAGAEDVENAFYALLHRAAQERRVIVLVDALNQFEPTVRARHLTWLRPKDWPGNARLIVTTLPCSQAEFLSKSAGVVEIELPPLTERDAEEIAERVWRRYHRRFNREVFRVLADKGSGAFGNPLWMNLALEQVNLLDADDFARAERDFTGDPAQRLRALLVDVARKMPPEVEGLFDWMLERAEKVHGAVWTRAFAAAIALSRSGWRDNDLLSLIPRLAPFVGLGLPTSDFRPPVSDIRSPTALEAAALRRSFRGQVVQRGELEQWDFFHAQMRAAVLRRCVAGEASGRALHRAIADHLLSLRPDDALRAAETMPHLVEADDKSRAARFYADTPDRSSALSASTQTLAARILASADPEAGAEVAWIASLLDQTGLQPGQIAALCNRFQFGLEDALTNEGRLGPRRRLLEATIVAGKRLAASDPSNAVWQRDLSVSQTRIGDVLLDQGDLAEARKAYWESLAVAERLAAVDPSNTAWQRDLSASQDRVGDVLFNQGDLVGALKAYRESLAVRERLAATARSNLVWQRDLSVSQEKIGDVLNTQGDLSGALKAHRESLAVRERLAAADRANLNWQRGLIASYDRIGVGLRAQGDLAGALKAYRESLAVAERLAAADPSNASRQRDLLFSQGKIGDIRFEQGDLAGALKAYRESLAVAERLAAADPSNADWQRNLSASYNNLGNVLRAQGDLAGALKAYRESLALRERLAAADPSNAGRQRDLSFSLGRVGDVLFDQGDLVGALKTYRESLAVAERLAAADPSNAVWQRDLSASQDRVGDVLLIWGDLAGALIAYRHSLAAAERLAKADPYNTDWQRDLSLSQDRVGDVLFGQGDLAGAFKAYRESLVIRERLTAADRSRAVWQFDLSASHIKIGDMLRTQGDLAGALKAYRESLAVRERLTAADPSNAGWQRGQSVSQEKIGDMRYAQGDLAGALKAYRESLAIRERLVAADLSNAGWQRDLWVSYWRMAAISEQTVQGAATMWWRKAYAQILAMKQRRILEPADEKYVEMLRTKAGV